MKAQRETFDAATASLRKGVNLVEASAGTGKTFAIAMLVLRFVTESSLPLPSILVVTFTKAATEELKGRIRARLASARDLLESNQRPGVSDQTDPALAAWRAGLAERGIAEPLALHRLEMALLDMDLAAVFTIHGFCQRMLQEQALESGQLFDFELTTDPSRLRAQVIQDYWRRNLYPLSPLHCALITEIYKTPDDLYKSVEGAGKRSARIEPPAPTVAEALTLFDKNLNHLSDWWQSNAATLHPLLQKAVDEGKFTKELQTNFSGWWQQVDDFLEGHSLQPPANIERLSAAGIRAELHGGKFRSSKEKSGEEKKEEFLTAWPLADQAIADFLLARQGVTLAFRIGLVRELSTGLAQTLRRQNLLSFDDLISQLATALVGGQGPALRQILSKRYQVALIDEFQDTDDAQYSIFSALFAGASHYLYLIGDPKQAIYTFRGADIYSYFKARDQADFHLGLEKNYRSHPALVESINRLFQLREDAFATEELSYFPVLPAKRADDGRLLDGGKGPAVMIYCELAANPDPDAKDGRWSTDQATERIVSYVVTETARLLHPDGPTMLTATDEPAIPLAPRDIAVLVRNHKQAGRFQAALARAGIPAVMASQQSVFTTDECHDLFLLMQALCAPGDTTVLKTALTSAWFGMNGLELYALWQDSEQVDLWLTRFHDYHLLWQERGFLAMMTSLLETEKILLNLARQPLADAGATRKISNIHHLLELIQAAETEEAMGPGKTLQWLQAMRTDTRSMEDTELRLESDEEAVRIVTMHSAKGLEYPVVFCPFLWQRGNFLKQQKEFVTCHDENRELVLDLGSPDFDRRKEQALAEELAEELRLAYVTLTRAKYRCYTLWADVKGNKDVTDANSPALAWLLSLEQGKEFASQIQTLQARAADGSVAYELLAADSAEPMVIAGGKAGVDELISFSFTGRNLHTEWLLHSYSSLSTPSPAHPFDNQSHWPDLSIETSEVGLLPDLPKGAALGNVVHALLENVPFATLATGSGYENLLQQQCAWFGVEVSPGRLAALLQKVVQTPLPPADSSASFCLAALNPSEVIREMPFYFQLQAGSTEQINSILAGSLTVTPITPKALQGYLTGFVDLICRYHGKFYIMDYKSNWLGNRLPDYGPEGLEQAMRDHNYGLQYWLYTLILHRYLQNSVEQYDYTSHFGGVMYLFVRGMEPTLPGSGVYFDLPDLATLERLDRCLGRSGKGSANG
ncbi:MAG: exodeoxyribonuclease V subunit beta [Deltaproteobacteria bacterium]|nr:exodeoxyribonuclease V subunit beta [Deltaproteobacteria bacterium]